MAMELQRGEVSQLQTEEESGKTTCLVGGKPVVIHPDLASNIAEGEEVAVAGIEQEQGLAALAINNITHHRGTSIDPSNIVLAMGAAGFICIVFFVLAMQNMVGGDTTLGTLAGGASLIGLAGIIVALQKILAIRRAAAMARFVDA